MQNLREELKRLVDAKYRDFQSELCPNVEDIMGVRVPQLRELAKKIARQDAVEFLENYEPGFYEERMIYGLVIGYMKEDLETKLKYLDKFVPLIDNWAICDCCCATFKFTNQNLEAVWEYIQKYVTSQNEFEVRFAVIMLMDYYINDKYIDRVLKIYNSIKLDAYYVKMGVAWGISVAYIKQKEKTAKFLKNNNLDDFTFNKAIQKLIESYRVCEGEKDVLRSLKNGGR